MSTQKKKNQHSMGLRALPLTLEKLKEAGANFHYHMDKRQALSYEV